MGLGRQPHQTGRLQPCGGPCQHERRARRDRTQHRHPFPCPTEIRAAHRQRQVRAGAVRPRQQDPFAERRKEALPPIDIWLVPPRRPLVAQLGQTPHGRPGLGRQAIVRLPIHPAVDRVFDQPGVTRHDEVAIEPGPGKPFLPVAQGRPDLLVAKAAGQPAYLLAQALLQAIGRHLLPARPAHEHQLCFATGIPHGRTYPMMGGAAPILLKKGTPRGVCRPHPPCGQQGLVRRAPHQRRMSGHQPFGLVRRATTGPQREHHHAQYCAHNHYVCRRAARPSPI